MFFKGLLNKKDKIFKKYIGTPIEWRENSSYNSDCRHRTTVNRLMSRLSHCKIAYGIRA